MIVKLIRPMLANTFSARGIHRSEYANEKTNRLIAMAAAGLSRFPLFAAFMLVLSEKGIVISMAAMEHIITRLHEIEEHLEKAAPAQK